MHCDEMENPKFTFSDLEHTTEACRGRVSALAMFEIIEKSDDRNFSDEQHDWRETFIGGIAESGFGGGGSKFSQNTNG